MNKDKLSYAEMLKDPRWQKRKTEILTRDNFTCQLCGDTEKSLHVHHLRYIKGNKPWEYEDEDLITLCGDCHNKTHEEINKQLMSDVKIGDVFVYYHSDYEDYLMCYDIDYNKKIVYLAGIDNGSCDDNFWVFGFTYNYVKTHCDKIDNFFNNEFDIDYRQKWLLGQFYCALYAKNKLYIYDFGVYKDSIFDIINKNIATIRKNNKGFNDLLCKALKNKSLIIQL